jgi:hypothetical protein
VEIAFDIESLEITLAQGAWAVAAHIVEGVKVFLDPEEGNI